VTAWSAATGNDRFNGEGGDDFLFGSDFNPDGSFVPNSGDDTLEGGSDHHSARLPSPAPASKNF